MESNQVGAEVRRLHVIYFISRKGRIEHPHLIRVHHLSRNGIHLRDVKRWLSELRGKEMPESFAWSYKRRYKSGYVWQDLTDEDLITPISDNEYVLKGSEISTSSTSAIEDSITEKKYSMQKEEEDGDHSATSQEEGHQDHHHHQENKMQEARKTSSPEIEEESPIYGSEKSSILTDDSPKAHDLVKHSDDRSSRQERHNEIDKTENPSFQKRKNKKPSNSKSDVAPEEKIGTPSSSSSSTSQPSFYKSRSYSNGASHLLRNLITCRDVDTNDSTMVSINRRNTMNVDSSSPKKHDQDPTDSIELLHRGDKLGGSQRVFGNNRSQQRQPTGRKSFDGVRASPKSKTEFSQKPNPTYKPIFGPQCSQCGKPFNPEKLHAHMKSCKGMKAWAKSSGPAVSATTGEKTSETSVESRDSLFSGYC